MIFGDLCTRRCPFCDVAHGRPKPPDAEEPRNLAATIRDMKLSYVFITSVGRDDLRDGGAGIVIEVLIPDFRGRLDVALVKLVADPPDVMNHNLETVPRLYEQARPGADYAHSLRPLQSFKPRHPHIPTKSGLMLTLGQYLQPTTGHLPVLRYVEPARFADFEREAMAMGFRHAACGPLVRSTYHADQQANTLIRGRTSDAP